MSRTVYVKNFGCQMNERDSEEVLGMLTAQGYAIAPNAEEADVILLNTCSVREHAEDRAYGKMGELSELKDTNPELILGIIGCMAKLHQEKIFKRLPRLDLVAGPAELYDLPYLLAEVQEKRQKYFTTLDTRYTRVLAVGRSHRPLEQKPSGDFRNSPVRAFVSIMEGCDKACTYCIVPKTRGQEISRAPHEIIAEINRLRDAGYQEVILLGQNVNSYGKRFPDGSGFKGPSGRLRLLEEDPDSLLDFAQLLRLVDLRTAICRVRFTTSHPFDANQRLFTAMKDCGAVCESLHLPVQSGSNRILRLMRRGYTVEAYLEKIKAIRSLIPDVALSTDIIVGFPGETDADFKATAQLMETVGYDSAYIFKYSPRPGTDAALREDDIPKEVKEERNRILLAQQEARAFAIHQAMIGREFEVLFEERGKLPGQWFGRTRQNEGVIVEHADDLAGKLLPVRVERMVTHTLFGSLCETPQLSRHVL